MYTFKSLICMIICIAPFCCTVIFSNATRPTSVIILDEMKSDKRLCIFPSDDLYNNLELLTMCEFRLPVKHKNISEYLKLNFVPLLCMSLYDVSLRLCDLTNLHPELKVKIPQTVQDFNVWETDIEKSEEYSSIGKFCSAAAIHSGSLLDRINGVTAEWINYFNTNLKNETVCKRVCQPSGLSNPDGVHPFCSFIIWSNNLYSATSTKSETTGVKNQEAVKNDEGNEERPDGIPPFNVDDIGATGGQFVKGLEFIPNGKQPELLPTHGIDILEHPQSKDMTPVEETYVQNSNSPKYNLNLKSKNNESMPNTKNITYVQIPIGDINKKPNDNLSNEPTQQGRESENKYLTEGRKESETDIETVNVSKEAQKPSTLNEAQLSGPITSLSQSDKTEKVPNVPELKESDNVEQAENPLTDDKSSLPEDEEFIHNNEDPIKASEDENQDDNDYQAPPPKENLPPKLQNEELSKDKDEYIVKDGFIEAEDSHFFMNFMSLAVLCIIAYLVFHNKKKLLALVVEGKRRGPARRRPNTASYSKLDCNLEEAMVSNTTASVTHVLY